MTMRTIARSLVVAAVVMSPGTTVSSPDSAGTRHSDQNLWTAPIVLADRSTPTPSGNVTVVVPRHPPQHTLKSLCEEVLAHDVSIREDSAVSQGTSELISSTGGTRVAAEAWCRAYLKPKKGGSRHQSGPTHRPEGTIGSGSSSAYADWPAVSFIYGPPING